MAHRIYDVCSTYHTTVPSIRISIGIIRLDNPRIAGLKVLSSGRLNLDNRLITTLCPVAAIDRRLSVDVAHSRGNTLFVSCIVVV
jgi:hypothetical protein